MHSISSAVRVLERVRHLSHAERMRVLQALPPQQLAELESALIPPKIPFSPHRPHPKQALFLGLPHIREVMFGGAAGGGKSDALLMDALQFVHKPHYRALLLRKTLTSANLSGAILDRARSWMVGTDVEWNELRKRFTFPSGATITIGYLQHVNDVYIYQGSDFHFIGWDELTQFPEWCYRYMFSRLRRDEGDDIPLRMRSATNPGGVGHAWVKERFVDPETKRDPKRRVFIPATLDDNPSLDREEYLESMAELDPVTRSQLLTGSWEAAAAGDLFKREWIESWVNPAAVPRMQKVVRFWDFAAGAPKKPSDDPDWTVGVKMGLGVDGYIYVLNVDRFRLGALGVKQRLLGNARMDGHGTMIYLEQEPGSAGPLIVSEYQQLLGGYTAFAYPARESKMERMGPFSSYAESGMLRVVRAAWNSEWLEELEHFPYASHDDQVDATSGAYLCLIGLGMKRGAKRAKSRVR